MIYMTIHQSTAGDKLFTNIETVEEIVGGGCSFDLWGEMYYDDEYAGLISELDMDIEEFNNLGVWPTMVNLFSKKQNKLIVEGAIAYKQKELRCKAKDKLWKYMDDRNQDFKERIIEVEVDRYLYLGSASEMLHQIAADAGSDLVDFAQAYIDKLKTHQYRVLGYENEVEQISKVLTKLDTIDAIYDFDIDKAVDKILTSPTAYKLMEKKIRKTATSKK